ADLQGGGDQVMGLFTAAPRLPGQGRDELVQSRLSARKIGAAAGEVEREAGNCGRRVVGQRRQVGDELLDPVQLTGLQVQPGEEDPVVVGPAAPATVAAVLLA